MKKIFLIAGVLFVASNCLGLLNSKDNGGGDNSWLALLGLGTTSEGLIPPTDAVVSSPVITDANGVTIQGISVVKSNMEVPFRIDGQQIPISSAYDISIQGMPSGEDGHTYLAEPVGIVFKYDADKLAKAHLVEEFSVFYYDSGSESWIQVPEVTHDIENGTVTAKTNHFTPYIITAVPMPNTSTGDAPPCIASSFPGGITSNGGTPAKFIVVGANYRYLQDRTYTIDPGGHWNTLNFEGALAVSTCNGDNIPNPSCGTAVEHKHNDQPGYVNFKAPQDIDVYMMFDSRVGNNINDTSKDPAWIAARGFTYINRRIATTDAVGQYRVYRKTYLKDEQVILDGNRYQMNASFPPDTNYWLIIKRAGVTGLDPVVNQCTVGAGANEDFSHLITVDKVEAFPGNDTAIVRWERPDRNDFEGVIIRRKLDTAPQTIEEGDPVTLNFQTDHSLIDDGLLPNRLYYYTIFAYDSNRGIETQTGADLPRVTVSVTTGLDSDGDLLSNSFEQFYTHESGQHTRFLSPAADTDTDEDGVDDGHEMAQGTDPTNPDIQKPMVTQFETPRPSQSTNPYVPLLITGSDNVGVTAWMLTRTNHAPMSYYGGWSSTKPESIQYDQAGTFDLYVWAKDAAGNVSSAISHLETNISYIPRTRSLMVMQNGQWFGGNLQRVSNHAVNATGLLVSEIGSYGIVGSDGHVNVWNGVDVVTSPNRKFAYVMQNGQWFGGNLQMVSVHRIDQNTGTLAEQLGTYGIVGSSGNTNVWLGIDLELDPTGRFLYVMQNGEFVGNPLQRVSVYSVNPSTGLITSYIQSYGAAEGGGNANVWNGVDIELDPTGRFLYCMQNGSWYGGNLQLLSVHAIDQTTGLITGKVGDYGIVGSEGHVNVWNGVDIELDPTGRYVYVMQNGQWFGGNLQMVSVHAVDLKTGLITGKQGDYGIVGSAGNLDVWRGVDLKVDPTGTKLYVLQNGEFMNEPVKAVRVLSLNPSTGLVNGNLQGYGRYSPGDSNLSVWDGWAMALWTSDSGNRPPIVKIRNTAVHTYTDINRKKFTAFDKYVQFGKVATFEINGTKDPDATTCSADANAYVKAFRFVSKPAGSSLTSTNILPLNTNGLYGFTPDAKGTYQVEFSFTDSAGTCSGGPSTTTAIETFIIAEEKFGPERKIRSDHPEDLGTKPSPEAILNGTGRYSWIFHTDRFGKFYLQKIQQVVGTCYGAGAASAPFGARTLLDECVSPDNVWLSDLQTDLNKNVNSICPSITQSMRGCSSSTQLVQVYWNSYQGLTAIPPYTNQYYHTQVLAQWVWWE